MSSIQNWSKTVTFQDRKFFQPRSVRELQEIVRSNLKIRARGTAHCFNKIADTSFSAVNLGLMPRDLEIDEQNKCVSVSAGMTYGQLTPELDRRGWGLSNLASLPHISIGGSISTGTHGSGIGNKSLANQVVSFDMVTADGGIRNIDRKNPEFEALVVGLGLAGIVYRYNLRVEPKYLIRQVVYPEISLEVLKADFDKIMGSAYSVSYFTDWASERIGNLWCKYREGEIIKASLGEKQKGLKKYHPIPSVNPEACTEQFGVPGNWHERLPHFKNEFTPSVGEEIQSEYFVERKFASSAIELLSTLGAEIQPLLWISEIRTIAADNLWLSGAYQRDSVAIHFTWKRDNAIYPVIEKIEATLNSFDYRPHWGKVFTADADYLESVYPKMDEFKALEKALDPTEKFRNSFIKEKLS